MIRSCTIGFTAAIGVGGRLANTKNTVCHPRRRIRSLLSLRAVITPDNPSASKAPSAEKLTEVTDSDIEEAGTVVEVSHASDVSSNVSYEAPSLNLSSTSQDSIIPSPFRKERATGSNFGSHRMRVFSGSSNPELAESIARYLGKTHSSSVLRKNFSDGETYVRVDESVRGCNVFIVQPTSEPVNDHLMELLIMIDACRRASAQQVTAVIPYYGYSRADRLIDPSGKRREALTSKLVANMLIKAGTDRVVLVDIHSPQTCGYFDIPVDHVYAFTLLATYLKSKKLQDFVVVAPDAGGVARARWFAKEVNDAPLAFIDKRREAHNVAKVLNLIGDVKGKTAVLVDDMIDTAGTITSAAKHLRECGARQVYAMTTHPVFSGPAIERLSSGAFEEVITTDTIALPESKKFKQLRILSIASLLGEQIWKIHEESSR